MTSTEYIAKWFGILDYIKTVWISDPTTGISPDSDVTTRIITGKGLQDDDWIGVLRNDDEVNPKVDRWLLALRGGKGEEPIAKGVGYFDKPVKLSVIYFADYRQGYDYDSVSGKTNSEREFLTKCIHLDWKLETLENGCLPGQVKVIKWDWETSIMKFPSDAVHHAQFAIELKMLSINF